jgi:hypothetical protein
MSRPHELNRSKVTGTKVPQKERRSKSAASSRSEEAGSAVRCKNETRVAGVICRTSAPSPFLMAILDLHQRLASKLEASVCLGVGAAAEASGCLRRHPRPPPRQERRRMFEMGATSLWRCTGAT